GVVRSTSSSTPPTIRFTVPKRPVGVPRDESTCRIRNAVVVFPFVPVMPATRSSAVGSPQKRTAIGAIAARESETRTWVACTSSNRSTTSATAPCSTARWPNSWPSVRCPGTQKKSVPGSTMRLSYARLPISAPASPTISATSVPASSSRSLIVAILWALVGRDLEVRQRELGDLAERGGGHLAAVVAALRLVDHNGDQKLRILSRSKAHEGGDVLGLRVGAVFRNLSGSRLAGQGVAGNADFRRR